MNKPFIENKIIFVWKYKEKRIWGLKRSDKIEIG